MTTADVRPAPRRRSRYRCILERAPVLSDITARVPCPADTDALGQLLHDAYRGTIDDEGETLTEARGAITQWWTGAFGPPLARHSRVREGVGRLRGATLVTAWPTPAEALVAFVVTAPADQRQGVAISLLHGALASLQAAGVQVVHAVVTDGNVPSERLLAQAGFTRVDAGA